MRVEVVRGDEDAVTLSLRGLEEPFEVLDGAVLADAGADQPPRDALLAQDVVLRVDHHQRRVGLAEVHRHAPWGVSLPGRSRATSASSSAMRACNSSTTGAT